MRYVKNGSTGINGLTLSEALPEINALAELIGIDAGEITFEGDEGFVSIHAQKDITEEEFREGSQHYKKGVTYGKIFEFAGNTYDKFRKMSTEEFNEYMRETQELVAGIDRMPFVTTDK